MTLGVAVLSVPRATPRLHSCAFLKYLFAWCLQRYANFESAVALVILCVQGCKEFGEALVGSRRD